MVGRDAGPSGWVLHLSEHYLPCGTARGAQCRPVGAGAFRCASEDVDCQPRRAPHTLQNVSFSSVDEVHSKPAGEEKVPGALPQPAFLPAAQHIVDLC